MTRSPQNQPESFGDAASESRNSLPLAVSNLEMSEHSTNNFNSNLPAELPGLELDFSSDTIGDASSPSPSTTKPPGLIGVKPDDSQPSVPKSSGTTTKPGDGSEKSREERGGGSLSDLLRERNGDAKPAVPPSPLAPTTNPPETKLPPVKPADVPPPIIEFPSGPAKPPDLNPPADANPPEVRKGPDNTTFEPGKKIAPIDYWSE